MITDYSEQSFIPIALGINQRTPPHLLKPSECVDAENFILRDGFAEKRGGYTPIFNCQTDIGVINHLTEGITCTVAANGAMTSSDDYFVIGDGDEPGAIIDFWGADGEIIFSLQVDSAPASATSAIGVQYGTKAIVAGTYSGGHWGRSTEEVHDYTASEIVDVQLMAPGDFMIYLDDVKINRTSSTVGRFCTLTLPDTIVFHTKDFLTGSRYVCYREYYDGELEFGLFCANGLDEVVFYSYDTNTFTDMNLSIIPKYIVPFYNVLYFANIPSFSDPPGDPPESDPFLVVFSDVGDAQNFNITENYFYRTEDGSVISSIFEHGNNLYLGKCAPGYTGQMWAIKPYDICERIYTNIGPSNNASLVSGKTLYFNYFGRIFTLDGQWIGEPIYPLVTPHEPDESWPLVGTYNAYTSEVCYTIGNKMFFLNEVRGGWKHWTIGESVKTIGVSQPGGMWAQLTENWETYLGTWNSLATDSSWFAIMNRNSIIASIPQNNDDGDPITATYITSVSSFGDDSIKKRFYNILVQGYYVADSPYPNDDCNKFTIYGMFHDAPEGKQYKELGVLTLGENGEGELGIDEWGIWASIKLVEQSRNPAKIYKLALAFEPVSKR